MCCWVHKGQIYVSFGCCFCGVFSLVLWDRCHWKETHLWCSLQRSWAPAGLLHWGFTGAQHTAQSQSTSWAVPQLLWVWPCPLLSKNICSTPGKIEVFFSLGQNKTVCFHFECKNFTLLPKADKYFCTLLQSCQDGRKAFCCYGLIVCILFLV